MMPTNTGHACRNKIALWLGMNAYIACGWCIFMGTLCKKNGGIDADGKEKGTIYYKGYKVPKPQSEWCGFRELLPVYVVVTLYSRRVCCKMLTAECIDLQSCILSHACRWFPNLPPRDRQMLVGDTRLRLPHNDQLRRGKLADSKAQTSTTLGCKGTALPVLLLPHVDYNSFFTVSIAHALLYGVCGNFLAHAFRKVARPDAKKGEFYAADVITHANRALIRARAADVRVTSEFGRQYKCIEQYMGSYKMEDWLHFICTFSEYIFLPGTLPPLLQRLWDLLVTAVRHYCGAGYTDASSIEAAASLRKFAELMEEYKFPDKQFTYNLHICVCQLRHQEKTRGAVSGSMEFVVERVMQYFKTLMGRRICKDPEKPFTNVFLLSQVGQIPVITSFKTYR